MRAISALLLPTASFAFTSPRFQRMATRNLGVRSGVKASDVLKTPVWPEVRSTVLLLNYFPFCLVNFFFFERAVLKLFS